MENVAKLVNMFASHWMSLYQALLFPLLFIDVKEALRVNRVIQNLHIEDRCRQMQFSPKKASLW